MDDRNILLIMIQTVYWLVENYAAIQRLANFFFWGGGGWGSTGPNSKYFKFEGHVICAATPRLFHHSPKAARVIQKEMGMVVFQ